MSENVVTMVEGIVPPQTWRALEDDYTNITKSPPEGILRSYLMQDRGELTLWRLVTLWQNIELLRAMQQANTVPPGIKIFKDLGVEPAVKVFSVKQSLSG